MRVRERLGHADGVEANPGDKGPAALPGPCVLSGLKLAAIGPPFQVAENFASKLPTKLHRLPTAPPPLPQVLPRLSVWPVPAALPNRSS